MKKIKKQPKFVPKVAAFTAVKRLASKLPLRDRLKLADAMWESVPPSVKKKAMAKKS